MVNGGIEGIITLEGIERFEFIDCHSRVGGDNVPTLDCMDLNNLDLQIRGYDGGVRLTNISTSGAVASIDLNSGHVILDSTVTMGDIVVRGSGYITDNSGPNVTVNIQGLSAGTSGLTAAESLQINEMHGQVRRSVYINTEAIAAGNGYQQTPFNTFTAAVDFAETNGLTKLILLADATVDRQLKNFIFEGIGDPVLDVNNQIIHKSEFEDLTLDGIIAVGSTIHAHDCTLNNNLTGLQGSFIECGIAGNLTLATGSQTVLNECFSTIGGAGRPHINVNGGTANVSIRAYAGGLTVGGMNDSGDQVTVSMSTGKLTIDNTNTLGFISVRGMSQFTDNTAGTVVDKDGLLDTFQQGLLVKLLKNRLETDPTTGILTVYDDDDVTVLLSGNIYEDVLAAQVYRGRGLERRDKLT